MEFAITIPRPPHHFASYRASWFRSRSTIFNRNKCRVSRFARAHTPLIRPFRTKRQFNLCNFQQLRRPRRAASISRGNDFLTRFLENFCSRSDNMRVCVYIYVYIIIELRLDTFFLPRSYRSRFYYYCFFLLFSFFKMEYCIYRNEIFKKLNIYILWRNKQESNYLLLFN